MDEGLAAGNSQRKRIWRSARAAEKKFEWGHWR
jgi:hypothetical protein